MLFKANHEDLFIVYGKYLKVKAIHPAKTYIIKFSLTNLIIEKEKIELKIGGQKVFIERINEFDTIRSKLKLTREEEITCKAYIYLDSENSIEAITSLMDNLCVLLTLAQGAKVNWLYYDAFSEVGEIIESFQTRAGIGKGRDFPLPNT